ncbi:MAG: hypothetical protein ACOY3D_06975 [Candidatus Omnitrophota bacterium]
MIDIVQTDSPSGLYNFSSKEKNTIVKGIPTTCHKFVFRHSIIVSSVELSDEEMIAIAERAGTFSFLNKPEEDIYTMEDGEAVQ